MSSFTFLAIILGTFSASVMPDIIGRNFTVGAIFCVGIAIIGLLTSLCIEYTPPAESEKKFNASIFKEIAATLRIAKQHPSLLITIFGSAFFLFLGAFVQLNLIPFAIEFMHLSDNQGGYLFLLTAFGIGSGSILAGKISGKTVELGLVPIAGLGVAVCCFLIEGLSDHFYLILPLVLLVGFFGGMYQIPLDSYIQVTSPSKYRGQIVATTNFISFLGVLCASGLMFLLNEVLHFQADKGFLVVGSITLMVTLVIGFQFFDYLSRFVAMLLSRLHFKMSFIGQQNIPTTPAVYVCTHSAWNDTLLILGAQRRRMRFFIKHEQDHSSWMKRLYRLLRVVMVPTIEPLEDDPVCLSVIRNTLAKGISVCIFVSSEDICAEIEKLKQSFAFQQILEENHYAMIPVAIEKGEKDKRTKFFTRLMDKIRVPALISFGSKINEPHPHIDDTHEFYAF
jgi:acyl-[acyl-carrier-protein]-phospholipid O-acyltransferase/long-chain-fatty-acid--[acyl-carrier-protein] ligase